jgi:hypothetical protein
VPGNALYYDDNLDVVRRYLKDETMATPTLPGIDCGNCRITRGPWMSSDDFAVFDWTMEHNLSEIVRFRNFVAADLERHTEECADDPIAKSSVDNYKEYLATNTFLIVYSYFEEYLYLISKWKARNVRRGRSNSIERYEPVLNYMGIATDHPNWRFMKQATYIRHCLLHANGRLAFMTVKKPMRGDIEAIVAQYPGELEVKHERLRVNDQFARRFVDEVRDFRLLVKQAIATLVP